MYMFTKLLCAALAVSMAVPAAGGRAYIRWVDCAADEAAMRSALFL